MPKSTAPKEDKGWSQANEISDAMLGIQPYSDDSMMFILRYGNQARVRNWPPKELQHRQS